MKQEIQQKIQKIVAILCGNVEDAQVISAHILRPKNAAHGDWTTNIAFILAKTLRKSPRIIAEELAVQLRNMLDSTKVAVSVVGGYVNFSFTPLAHQDILRKMIAHGADWGNGNSGDGVRVLVEYVSANPTGPLHLGNARGGPYGDTLSSVLVKSGYSVTREYYVNDYGNQITVLGHSITGGELAQYRGEYIDDLRAKLIDNNSDDSFDISDAQIVGREAAERIVTEIIVPALANAGIKFDNFFSEKSLHARGAVDATVAQLTELDLTYEEGGALFFRSTDIDSTDDDKDRVLVTADGRKTYFCADIAYHLDKFTRADKLINIWGADHGGTVARLQGALAVLGHADKLDIILTQFVRVMEDGVEVKMSKRRGTYITLTDLIEEVGADVTRFLFLMQAATTHVVFDLNAAREKSDKNPVYYVQYAHARMVSILRKAQAEGIISDTNVSSDTNQDTNINTKMSADLSLLTHTKEINLIRVLAEFPEIIARTASDYQVHRLPHYAIRIADSLHSFYAVCKVVDTAQPELSRARVELVCTTRIILAETLRIIGVAAPEQM